MDIPFTTDPSTKNGFYDDTRLMEETQTQSEASTS